MYIITFKKFVIKYFYVLCVLVSIFQKLESKSMSASSDKNFLARPFHQSSTCLSTTSFLFSDSGKLALDFSGNKEVKGFTPV